MVWVASTFSQIGVLRLSFCALSHIIVAVVVIIIILMTFLRLGLVL